MRHAVYIRADGHYQFGLGHMFRSLTVAEGLRAAGAEVRFASLRMLEATNFPKVLARHGIGLDWVSGDNDFVEDSARLAEGVGSFDPTVILTDLLTPDPEDADLMAHPDLRFPDRAAQIDGLRDFGLPIVSFTDEQERVAIRPDVVIDHSLYRPVEDYGAWAEPMFKIGPDYFPLFEDIRAAISGRRNAPESARRLLVLFGGSDHNGYIPKAAKAAIAAGIEAGIERVDVIIGPAVANADALQSDLDGLGCVTHRAPPSIAGLMAEADIAVTSGGNTVFEFAALGTPMITLCVRRRQDGNASYFQSRGAALNMGLGDDVSEAALRDAITGLSADRKQRQAMSDAGRACVDGKGRDRVVETLLAASVRGFNGKETGR